MRLTPLSPFGAAIEGLDVRHANDVLGERLALLAARYRVIVLRDQCPSARQMVAFLRTVGELSFTQGEVPVEDAPLLNLVTNIGRDRPPRSVFHTDTSYVRVPPAFTALRIVRVPDEGGDTLFTDQVRALDALSESERAELAARTIRHSYAAPGQDEIATDHPVVLTHPLTGERSLYLSTPERCIRISGCDTDTSRKWIERLYTHSIDKTHIYRHQWLAGDIVLWDNRVTMHRADHAMVVGDRELHRGIILPR